jgi:hypothetical protein
MASWIRQALGRRIARLAVTSPAETSQDTGTHWGEVALAPTMTVRCIWRGDGPGYIGAFIRTVTIKAICPQCGGPRGEPKPHRFCEDGEWLTCDVWQNPCDHIDMYSAVLAEARDAVAVR